MKTPRASKINLSSLAARLPGPEPLEKQKDKLAGEINAISNRAGRADQVADVFTKAPHLGMKTKASPEVLAMLDYMEERPGAMQELASLAANSATEDRQAIKQLEARLKQVRLLGRISSQLPGVLHDPIDPIYGCNVEWVTGVLRDSLAGIDVDQLRELTGVRISKDDLHRLDVELCQQAIGLQITDLHRTGLEGIEHLVRLMSELGDFSRFREALLMLADRGRIPDAVPWEPVMGEAFEPWISGLVTALNRAPDCEAGRIAAQCLLQAQCFREDFEEHRRRGPLELPELSDAARRVLEEERDLWDALKRSTDEGLARRSAGAIAALSAWPDPTAASNLVTRVGRASKQALRGYPELVTLARFLLSQELDPPTTSNQLILFGDDLGRIQDLVDEAGG